MIPFLIVLPFVAFDKCICRIISSTTEIPVLAISAGIILIFVSSVSLLSSVSDHSGWKMYLLSTHLSKPIVISFLVLFLQRIDTVKPVISAL